MFRTIDTLLDARAGVKFALSDDPWWASLTGVFVLTSPMAQHLYMRYLGEEDAWEYAVPFSYKHLQNERIHLRFAAILPQSAMYQNVHGLVGKLALNEVLAIPPPYEWIFRRITNWL